MVEGSMTQGAGQGPVVRTATLRDFRVPPYAQVPVQGHSEHPQPQQPRQPAPRHPAQPQQPPQASEPRVPQQAHPHQAQPPLPPVPASQPPAAHLPHPGNAFPDDEYPDGYTPTERDLPVINRGDTLQVSVTAPPDPASAAPLVGQGPGPGPLYVVGDVHGYLDELLVALREQGLVDADGRWAAGNTRLWFLGDFTDRGPDGIGVIDLVMRLSAEAAAAGGYCKALMGNHELLLLGAKRFGDTPVNSGAGTATFQAAWLLNGGQKSDMDRLQDVHLQWMSRLDAIVEQDDHLLLHSDTTAYLEYGDTIEDVNDTVHEILTRNDADECWDLFRKFTKRFAFRDEGGANAARELLATYGGRRVVHGHSPIPYLLGEVGTEDADGESTGPVVEGPHVYADGLAIAMDGGVTMAGKLLVQQLPLPH
ncbi:metallophosphoesterase [Streptomyces roseolilacinus]|uniref:metallophosphoesterase n=1 Tax=Streptomyces roseolilacinus TaxID=66904 RepID=UPI003570FCE4